MIALLHGVLAERSPGRVVIMASGVGYEVLVPGSTLEQLASVGSEVRLLTRLQVREDSMVLYGFATADERSMFDQLVTVTGVGPKLALTVLSTLAADDVRRAIFAQDATALTSVSGIGKKVAGRILLDLKDAVGATNAEHATGPLAEVREALLALGLSPEEARDAVADLQPDQEVAILLRQALQSVGRG